MNRCLKTLPVIVLAALLFGQNALQAVETVAKNGIDYVLTKSREEIIIPEGTPETHTVVKGDTLWDISKTYLNDNYLWPIIWEFNLDHIPNPHLIFPGQIVYLPRPVARPVTPTEGTGVGDETPIPDGGVGLGTPVPGEEPELRRPAVSGKEMETCGYISPIRKDTFKIIGGEDPEFQKSENDLVYVNMGSRDNVAPGDNFYIFQYLRKVYHPITGKFLGWFTNNLGVLQLICVFEKSSLAVIIDSFEPINIGDYVAPYTQIPAPLTRDTRLGICSTPSKEVTGYIVEAQKNFLAVQDAVLISEGEIGFIDRGYKDGIGPGDYFMLYDDTAQHPDAPEIAIGECIVLRSQDETSTVFITRGYREFELGTPVDYILLAGPVVQTENVLPVSGATIE